MKLAKLAREAAKGAIVGSLAGVALLGVGLLRALVAVALGRTINWATDLAMLGGYVAIFSIVGAVGRTLWVLAEDTATRMTACMGGGIVGGTMMMKLVDNEADTLLLVLGGIYGALMGLAFWYGGKRVGS